MEAIASEAASGTSSAREAARRLGLPPSSDRNILRRILQLYPYKLQSCYELLPVETTQREAFAKWAFSKMEQDPTWVFNILWTDEAHFSLHGDVNNHICRIWATSNPREYTQKPLHSPKVTAWCGFTGSFIIGYFFFETQCPVNGWITETVNAQRYLTFLRETAVPCLIQRGQISNVAFTQDGATSHTANPVKAFPIQTFEEDRIVSRRCSSSVNPTPLAHADNQRDVHSRGISHWRPTRFNLYDPEIRSARGFNTLPEKCTFPGHLLRRAQDWYQIFGSALAQNNATDFAQLKVALPKAFPAIQNRKDLEIRFYASQQRRNQESADFIYNLLKLNKKLELGMSEKALVDHIFVRLEPQVQDYVEVRNPQNTVQLLEVLAKFEESYSPKAIRGSRNSDNVERRGWNEHRMSNVDDN
ncbi:uncharacterized protein TNCV_3543581 [Trichonephila clavipes]|nr:uncharacterized protein TNCV_3543581 [Trichonephila clavipes]